MTDPSVDQVGDPDATLRRWFERDQAIGGAAERRQLELRVVELEAQLVDQQHLAQELAGRVDELTVQLARNEQAAAAAGRIQRVLAGLVRRAGGSDAAAASGVVVTAPAVSVVIPTIGSSGVVDGTERVFVESAVASVSATAGVEVEVVLVCGPRTPTDVRARLDATGSTVVDIDGPFNFAASVNLGAAHARAGRVLFLNDDTEAVSDGWLRTMCDALGPGVGAVGARLLFEDGTLQHAGHTYRTSLEHVGFGLAGDAGGPHDLLHQRRRVAGVTAACLLTTMDALDSVGGFCTDFPANYNDVDLCMKLRALGYDIVYEPAAVLRHFESRSRVAGVTADEIARIQARWFADLLVDPFSPVVA